jgi:hypothetical protein
VSLGTTYEVFPIPATSHALESGAYVDVGLQVLGVGLLP